MVRATVRKRALSVGAACIGIAAAAAVVIPALAASSPSAVRLHMGSDGTYFAYGNQQQPLTTSGCKINSPEPLIDLSAGNGKHPGLVSKSIGVKGSSSTGTPCGQVESGETLKLARGGDLGGRKFTGVRLDLEMTGNAIVKLTLASSTRTESYQLQTGRSITTAQSTEPGYDGSAPYVASSGAGDQVDACAAPNSSGPNSSINDNCEWTVMPGFDFDTVTLTALQSAHGGGDDDDDRSAKGTVALEGGGDFGNDPEHDTLLYLANTAPTATGDSYTTNEDVPVSGNVLSNDTDADGNPLTAALAGIAPASGTVTLASNGTFTYEPDPNFHGSDSFQYRASDGTATSALATVDLTVTPANDPPVATGDGADIDEDGTQTVVVATDVDGNAGLRVSCPDLPDGWTVVDLGSGAVEITPAPDFNGILTIACTVEDAAGATTESDVTIVVGVTPVNDPPVANDDFPEVDNTGEAVAIDVLGNDTDVDDLDLTVEAFDSLSVQGGAVALVAGALTYTPPLDFEGADSFTYAASDGELSDTATVHITVFPVICSTETVATDGETAANGSFTRLSDSQECKRYELEAADVGGGTVLFVPQGGDPEAPNVFYRGTLSFGVEDAPEAGPFPLLLRYDPDDDGPAGVRDVLFCVNPQFVDGVVSEAELPPGESWCVASAAIEGVGTGIEVTWQVYGEDDPRFIR